MLNVELIVWKISCPWKNGPNWEKLRRNALCFSKLSLAGKDQPHIKVIVLRLIDWESEAYSRMISILHVAGISNVVDNGLVSWERNESKVDIYS